MVSAVSFALGHPGPVLVFARRRRVCGGGLLADVVDPRLASASACGRRSTAALIGIALFDDLGEVGLVGDEAVFVLGGLVVAVGGDPVFGGGGLCGLVGVDAAGGQFVAGALFGGAGCGGVGVPVGADLVGALELLGAFVEDRGQRKGFGGFAFQLGAPVWFGLVGGFGGAQCGGGAVALGGLDGSG